MTSVLSQIREATRDAWNDVVRYFDEWDELSVVIYDPKLELYPWGFSDREAEANYRKYFWLTFASNNKRFLFWIYSFACSTSALNVLRYLLDGDFRFTTFGSQALFTTFTGTVAFFFSKRVLAHSFKRVFTIVLEIALIIGPPTMLLEACQPTAPRSKQVTDTIMISFTGYFFCPRFWQIVFNVVIFNWVPIIWVVVSGRRNLDRFSAEGYEDVHWAERRAVEATAFTSLSLLWGALVNVHRRKRWHTDIQRRKEPGSTTGPSQDRQRRGSRSPSPARRRSSSPSARAGGPVGRRYSRSPSPLPMVDEGRATRGAVQGRLTSVSERK